MKSPEDIYASVSNEIDVILAKLKTLPANNEIASAKEKAEEIFDAISVELKDNVESLKRNAEWNTFTIAFYGETNAGKSTIIETMRLMLNEPGKIKQQKEFKALQERLGITPDHLQAMNTAVTVAEQSIENFKRNLSQVNVAHNLETQRLNTEITALRELIQQHKQTASLWQKLLDHFIKRPEQIKIQEFLNELRTREDAHRLSSASLQQECDKANQRYEACKLALDEANLSIAKLAEHADGAIIGKGMSDFTRDATIYEITANSQKFALLDLPGIEGKEALVLDGIWAGVKKAHAVFYVTGKAAAPQKGDGTHMGTLEKIKQQLGTQTEVWTIYNKRITNPIALQRGTLTESDEATSLHDVDEKMTSVLGRNYRGSIILSAHAAFLASAKCLVPNSDAAKSKAKFDAKYSEEELLKLSGIAEFKNILVDRLVQDCRAKIVRSNFNKADGAVINAMSRVSNILENSFKPLAIKLIEDAEVSQSQLDLSLDTLRNRLTSQGESAVTEFTENVRSAIYEEIDCDIDNDDFKEAFESIILSKQKALIENLPERMQLEVDKFQVQIRDVIDRFENFAAEVIDTYGNLARSSFSKNINLKINLNSGINVPGLVSALIGAGLMFWNPAGWGLLALGAVSLIVGVYKSVRSLFSSDYKKSQQRKSANSNLRDIDGKLRESLRETLDAAIPQLQATLDAVKTTLELPAQQVQQMIVVLGQAEKQLKNISNIIKTEGVL